MVQRPIWNSEALSHNSKSVVVELWRRQQDSLWLTLPWLKTLQKFASHHTSSIPSSCIVVGLQFGTQLLHSAVSEVATAQDLNHVSSKWNAFQIWSMEFWWKMQLFWCKPPDAAGVFPRVPLTGKKQGRPSAAEVQRREKCVCLI